MSVHAVQDLRYVQMTQVCAMMLMNVLKTIHAHKPVLIHLDPINAPVIQDTYH